MTPEIHHPDAFNSILGHATERQKQQIEQFDKVKPIYRFSLCTFSYGRTRIYYRMSMVYWSDTLNMGVIDSGSFLASEMSFPPVSNARHLPFMLHMKEQRYCQCEQCNPSPPHQFNQFESVYFVTTLRTCWSCGRIEIIDTPASAEMEDFRITHNPDDNTPNVHKSRLYFGEKDTIGLETYLRLCFLRNLCQDNRNFLFNRCSHCQKDHPKNPYWMIEEGWERRATDAYGDKGIPFGDFLRLRMWRKYKVKEPDKEVVRRCAARHLKRAGKRLTRHEASFFTMMAGAAAISRAMGNKTTRGDGYGYDSGKGKHRTVA